MAAEKTAEPKGGGGAARSAELILSRLGDYLSIRFDQAGRINPQLKLIKQDLIFHELANVRRSLMGEKLYGPVRQGVAEVFLGDDDKKRRGLMSATDQTSVQVELVSHCQDERVETTRGQIRIHDLKTFYAAIDDSIANLIDLIETWIWWDIMDAAELVRFEQKLGIIAMIRQGRMSEEMRKRYGALIQPAPGGEEEHAAVSLTDEDAIRYEFRQLVHLRDQWAARRQGERGYMYILKRDEQAAKQGELLHLITAKVREYDAIESEEELDEGVRQRFVTELALAPEKITRTLILEYVQGQLLQIEREMLKEADHETKLGPPYNYKERQLEQMDKWLFDLNQQMRGTLRPAPAAGPAPPAQPAPAAQPAPPAQPAPAAGPAPANPPAS